MTTKSLRRSKKSDWREKYWQDKFRNKVKPEDMEDYHLLCAMRCCQNYTKDREQQKIKQLSAISSDTSVNKEIRETALERLRSIEIDGISIASEFPIYPKLCAEALKRGLL